MKQECQWDATRGQQVSVIAQENMKLVAFLFHHRWRSTLDWEIMGVDEDTVHLMAGQKKLEDEYKDLKMNGYLLLYALVDYCIDNM